MENKLFPLRVVEEDIYLGMGEYGSRFKIITNNGDKICYSDYEPLRVDELNDFVEKLLERIN